MLKHWIFMQGVSNTLDYSRDSLIFYLIGVVLACLPLPVLNAQSNRFALARSVGYL